MTTVSASRPTTMAGRPGTSQPAEGAPWDDPAAQQWEAPLTDPDTVSRVQSAAHQRPKTAGGSRSAGTY